MGSEEAALIRRHAQMLFLLAVVVYSLMAWGRGGALSPYSNHLYFAEAYTHGRLGLEEDQYQPTKMRIYPELLPSRGMLYNPQGPMPAILMMPLAFFLGHNFSEYGFSILLSSFTAMVFMLSLFSLRRRGFSLSLREIWTFTTLYAFGTPVLIYSADGTFWFVNHLCALLFLNLALLAWIRDDCSWHRSFWIGILFGGSFLSRYYALLFALAYYWFVVVSAELSWSEKIKKMVGVSAGLAIFGAIFMLHNWLRFGEVLHTGYETYAGGQFFYFSKIGPHLCNALLLLPYMCKDFPWVCFSQQGCSVFFMTPLLLWLFRIDYVTPWHRSILFGGGILFLFLMGYPNNGAWQIGYRYLLEFYPFVIFLLAISSSQIKKGTFFYCLFILGIVANVWGGIVIHRAEFGRFWIEESYVTDLTAPGAGTVYLPAE